VLSRNKVVLTEVGAGAIKFDNPSLIGRAVVFEIIGVGSSPMGWVDFIYFLVL
jgi:hypothetical protein